MTGPLATRDWCCCGCHGSVGALRYQPGGCAECALVHPPGEGMMVWDDEPEAAPFPTPAVVAEAEAIVDRIEQLPGPVPGVPCG